MDSPDPRIAVAATRLAAGDAPGARALAEAVLQGAPHASAARLIAVRACFIAGDLAAALAHAGAGAAHDPACAEFPLGRARCLLAQDQPDAARAALAEAVRLAEAADAPGALWGMIGDAHTLANAFEAATHAYTRAIARDPQAAVHWFNRAMVHRYRGATHSAAADFAQAVQRDPDNAEAWYNLVEVERQTPAANRIAAIAAMAGRLPHGADEARLAFAHYALAKAYEDLGEALNSLAHCDAGARAKRATLAYDVRADLGLMDAALRVPGAVRSDGDTTIAPIFVVGLQRSGSTVIERILTSHSAVESVGESPAFALAVGDAARAAGIDPSDSTALLSGLARLDPAAIGRAYAARTAPWRGGARVFVDKLPDNFVHAGLIARALPHARIVHSRRHPLGHCHALYKTLFNRAAPWSYTLDELVAYFAGYRRLMAHWQESLGTALMTLDHEALVDDPEGAIRRLLAHCGLDWEPACMAFHLNPKPSTTQSAAQVRRPLNREGADRWRRIAPLLAPLADRLAAAGIAV